MDDGPAHVVGLHIFDCPTDPGKKGDGKSNQGCPIAIDDKTYKELLASDSTWKNVLSPEKAISKCLVFSEVSVRDGLFDIKDENEKTKMLLELRRNSLLPAHEVAAEPDYFADSIKAYQLEQNIQPVTQIEL